MPIPKVKKSQLLESFNRLCEAYGVESAGFDPNKIASPFDGHWAMSYTKNLGWMIVCGMGGCGAKFTRFNGYIKNRWDFLMFIEGIFWAKKDGEKK